MPHPSLPVPAASVLEALPISVVVTGGAEEGTPILYANPAFERLTGYTVEEALGKNPRMLQPSPLPAGQVAARQRMARVVSSESGGQGRILNRRKDNSAFWAEISIAPIRDASGRCVGYVGAQIDGTHRVDHDKQLMQERETAINRQVYLLDRILWAHARLAAKHSEQLCRLAAAAAPCWPDINARTLTLAAHLAYVGLVTDTEDLMGLRERGVELNEAQQVTLAQYPAIGADLLAGIPGLGAVAETIRWHLTPFNPETPAHGAPTGDAIPKTSRVLHLLQELNLLVCRMHPPAQAIAEMAKDPQRFDHALLFELSGYLPTLTQRGWPGRWEAVELPISDLMTGMIFDQDVRDRQGRLLIRKGQEINESILASLRDQARRELVSGPIRAARHCA